MKLSVPLNALSVVLTAAVVPACGSASHSTPQETDNPTTSKADQK